MGKAARARAQARRTSPPRRGQTPKGLRVEHFAFPLLVAAGLIAYHNSFRGPFVFDDIPAITWNTTIRTLWPPSTVLSPPPRTAATGRPIVNLSLALNYALSGYKVGSYHVFNLSLHILSALVLFGVILRTLRSPGLHAGYRDRALGIATATALLWVVHPLTTDSVAYTIQRTELLGSLFILLTLYCAIRSFESPNERRWSIGALAAFALGLGSKEVIIVAPILVLAWDWLFLSTSLKEAIRRHRVLYVGFAVVLVLFVLLVGTRLRKTFTGTGQQMSPWHYALTESGVIVHYLRLALWPHPLSSDYDGWPIATSVLTVLPHAVIIVALVALALWGLVRRRKVSFLGVWFFALLAPTSSFRPLSWEVAAERRMYLPLAAIILLLLLGGSTFLSSLQAPRLAGSFLVATLAVILAVGTVRRNEDYRTPIIFWNDVVVKRPDNPRARISLGYYLYKEGRSADALSHLAEAVRLQPENANARYSFGVMLANQGRTREAIDQYREAVRIDPGNPRTHVNYAVALTRQGFRDEAINHLEMALRLNPDLSSARRLLGQLRNGSSR
jgi:tetratricopeptide (TPR) repeat protein